MGDYTLDYFVDKIIDLNDLRKYNFFGLFPIHAGRNIISYEVNLRHAVSVSSGLEAISVSKTPEQVRSGLKNVLKTINCVHQTHAASKHYGYEMCHYVNYQHRNAYAFDRFERIHRESIGLVQSRRGTSDQVQDIVNQFRIAYTNWMKHIDSPLLTGYRMI